MEGRISELEEDSFEISGKRIFVDGRTVITEFGVPLDFDSLRQDWKVRVLAEPRQQNRLWALEIEVLERSQGGVEVDAKGVISNLVDSTMTVNGIVFVIVSNTELRDKKDRPIALSGFVVGMRVEAKGVTNAAGEVIATEIKIKDEHSGDREIEFTGPVVAVFHHPPLPDSLQVNGQILEIDAQTALFGFDNEPIQLSDLQYGEEVEVRARTRENAIPRALRVKRTEPGRSEVQVTGRIDELGDSTLVVTGLSFTILPGTIILDDENFFITFAQLQVGLVVEIQGRRLSGNDLVATHIKVEDEVDDEIEITGYLESLTASSLTVSSQDFLLIPATAVFDEQGSPTTRAALQIGMQIEVKGDRRFNGTIVARKIWILDFLGNEVVIRGEIEAVHDNRLRVTGVEFRSNANTEIRDQNGNTIPFAALSVKSVVELRAARSNSHWLARRIVLEETTDDQLLLTAAIDSLAEDMLHTLGHRIHVVDRTQILDEDRTALSFAELEAGQVVEAIAKTLADGSLLASRLIRRNLSATLARAGGVIESLSPSRITVTGLQVEIDAGTRFVDVHGQPVARDSLYLGAVVTVEGERRTGGRLKATQITMAPRRVLTGVVSGVNNETLEIQGILQDLTPATLVLSEQNRALSLSDLQPQQQVRLSAGFVNGNWETLTVRLLFRSEQTAVATPESPTSAPRVFALEPGYPNPFDRRMAATSTIHFFLPEPGRITAVVVNLLGQSVATLLDTHLPAGRHVVQWNGRDQANRRVAPGVYFYRVRAGREVATGKVVVLH